MPQNSSDYYMTKLFASIGLRHRPIDMFLVFEQIEVIIIIIIIIIYLLKQEDTHMINTRTRAGQERHRKLALTFCL